MFLVLKIPNCYPSLFQTIFDKYFRWYLTVNIFVYMDDWFVNMYVFEANNRNVLALSKTVQVKYKH